ncbi:GlcG/HbpS family heme-binding protein [Methylobacterium nigriterrae]|uniref:GlcG/HbpS family heme-binding protein n=1 Tax=Methylobacterium nigriterrae TaxID=3127512 RepID=UPI003013EAE5
MRASLWAAVPAVLVLTLGQALAQQPGTPPAAPPPAQPPSGGTPDKMPYDVPYGAPISLDRAKDALAAAEAEARKRNWKMNIAVVDPNGDLLHFVRMDGAQLASITISQNKARTAARWRRESRVFYNQFETGHPYIGTLDPLLAASPGGFPLVQDGKIVGAIGCSGGTGDQDALICKVGADTLK